MLFLRVSPLRERAKEEEEEVEAAQLSEEEEEVAGMAYVLRAAAAERLMRNLYSKRSEEGKRAIAIAKLGHHSESKAAGVGTGQCCQMAKFDPPTPSTLAQSKERKGSNFAA